MPSRLLLALLALPCAALAADLREASVNQIINDVRVVHPRQGARAAVLKETIKDDLGVATGPQSRAELLFQDNTLTRLGAETFFHFKAGTRDLTLDKGTMLLQVPKGRGGARIRSGSVTASITGTTIMIEHLPRKQVRVLVLEGSLQLSVNGRPGESRELTAGRMITLDPQAKRVPESVAVDLRKLVEGSSLIDQRGFKGNSKAAAPAPLPSLGLIRKEIVHQQERLSARPAVAIETRSRVNIVSAGDSSLKTNHAVARAQESTMAEVASKSGVKGSAQVRVAAVNLARVSTAVRAANSSVFEIEKVNGEKEDRSDKSGSSGRDKLREDKSGKDRKGDD